MRRPVGKTQVTVYACLLCVVVFIAYSPLLFADFINFDDPLYVTGNAYVKAGLTFRGIAWALTSFDSYNWHPLTWISHMLDVQMFGLNPLAHHLVNLLLHLANTLLLFGVFRKMTGATWQSLAVAGLFALHPLHVESVAWVSERKDVLSTLFWLLTMWVYIDYVRRPGFAAYLAVLLLFALGLMSKPMLVTLPAVLLLLDYWPLGRFCANLQDGERSVENPDYKPVRTLVIEKAPLFALTIASCILTYLAEKQEGGFSRAGSVAVNAENALMTYVVYLERMLWPVKLAVFYPLDPAGVSLRKAAAAGLVLLGLSAMVIWGARRRRYLATGWFWYLGTLVPVIGFVKVGNLAMADRYTYIPLIGMFVMVAWGAGDVTARWPRGKNALVMVAVVIFTILSVMTWRQATHWRNSIALFTHAIEVTDNNLLAHNNLANAMVVEGRLQEALFHVAESLRIKPDPYQYVSQAWLLAQAGNHKSSIESCRKALAMDPDDEEAHLFLGLGYLSIGEHPLAMAEYDFLRKTGSRLAPELLDAIQEAGVTIPSR
jgi:hypothetical protein